jgi:hypothetical protein
MSLLSLGKATTGCHRERRRNRMEMRPETIHSKCVPRVQTWNEKQLCKEYIHIFSTSVRYLPTQVDPMVIEIASPFRGLCNKSSIGLYILIHKNFCCGLKEVQFLLLISGRTHIFILDTLVYRWSRINQEEDPVKHDNHNLLNHIN